MEAVRARFLGLRAVAAIFLILFTTTGVARAAVLHFDASTPLKLVPSPVVVSLFNDSPRDLVLHRATASLDPAASGGGTSTSVRIEIDVGDGFAPFKRGAVIPAFGRARVRLTAPKAARAGATGWLTIVANTTMFSAVARRAIEIPEKVSKPAVSSWTVTSIQSWPWDHAGGDVGAAIPLTPGSQCSDVADQTTVLVAGDRTVSVTTSCDNEKVQLRSGNFPSPGTYAGDVKLGDDVVKVEVDRTMSVWWPILLILLGFLLAMWSQGRLNQGWRWQQRWWLYRLPGRAATQDAIYKIAARDTPWEKYDLEPAIEGGCETARAQLRDIAENRPLLLRFLPWPDGFMQSEREAVRKAIVTMDQLVRDWPTMPAALANANQRLYSHPYYPVRAPKLFERALLIIGAAGLPADVAELTARRAEATALPSALDVIDEIDLLDGYLSRLEEQTISRPPQDEDILVRARQYQREAAANLLHVSDATRVSNEVGTIVDRASRLASRLPPPGAAEPDEEQLRTETVGGARLLRIPLAAFRRAREALQATTLVVGHTTLIVLTLAVGVWSGLAVLYIGKSWGGSYGDYVAAFVWGFGAATVIAPVVSAAKQLGTRPQDATSTSDAQ